MGELDLAEEEEGGAGGEEGGFYVRVRDGEEGCRLERRKEMNGALLMWIRRRSRGGGRG